MRRDFRPDMDDAYDLLDPDSDARMNFMADYGHLFKRYPQSTTKSSEKIYYSTSNSGNGKHYKFWTRTKISKFLVVSGIVDAIAVIAIIIIALVI